MYSLIAKASIRIENTVATANLKQMIDLNSIVRLFPWVKYQPEVFPGLVYKLKEPKTATLIFSSGKMVCTGGKSEKLAKQAIMKVVDELRKKKIVTTEKLDIEIQNIVASGELDGTIDLDKAAYSLEKTLYEPEQFPGIIHRMSEPKVVILLFSTGKFVCVGAKKEEEIPRAISKLQETLEEKELIHYTKPSSQA